MTSVKTAALVIVKGGPLGGSQPCVSKEPVGSLFVGIGHGRTVQLFRDKYWRLALAGMEDGEGVIAQGAVCGSLRNHWRLGVGEELGTG